MDFAEPTIDYLALARSMGVTATAVDRPADIAANPSPRPWPQAAPTSSSSRWRPPEGAPTGGTLCRQKIVFGAL